MNLEETQGSVFDHLGFSPQEAAELKLKSALARHIRLAIEARGLTQSEAAQRTGLRQPEISRVVNVNFTAMSVSRLFKAAVALGAEVEVIIKSHEGDAPGSLEVVA
jgi:predicted XRE-type DNA-binding protein